MNIDGLSFEEAIRKLGDIATELERGSADLERSLALYEDGIKLIRYCNKTLDEAQRKVKLLGISPDGELTESDFSTTAEDKEL